MPREKSRIMRCRSPPSRILKIQPFSKLNREDTILRIIRYIFTDGTTSEVKVSDEFAEQYAELEHKDKLIERRETRRHQSLDKFMEHGWDIADPQMDIQSEAERRELSGQLKTALHKLTDRQRTVFLLYVLDGLSFREIGEEMNIGTRQFGNITKRQ